MVGDDGRAIALFMRLFGLFATRFRMVERSRFQTSAARLLPGLGSLDECVQETNRVADIADPADAVRRVVEGGLVLDPVIVSLPEGA